MGKHLHVTTPLRKKWGLSEKTQCPQLGVCLDPYLYDPSSLRGTYGIYGTGSGSAQQRAGQARALTKPQHAPQLKSLPELRSEVSWFLEWTGVMFWHHFTDKAFWLDLEGLLVLGFEACFFCCF